MTQSFRDRVGTSLEILQTGIQPFVERQMAAKFGQKWQYKASEGLKDHQFTADGKGIKPDIAIWLTIMLNNWNEAFYSILGPMERSWTTELRGWRNKWAHQEPFNADEAGRAIDSAYFLLNTIAASEQAEEVNRLRVELQRQRYEDSTRHEAKRLSTTVKKNSGPLGNGGSGLKPWRDVITPHPDVARGSYQVAEFAADLGQVYKESSGVAEEYRDPMMFFQRTYLTLGLKNLLKNALQRLHGDGGDPIINMQTNFGGGKTHSLLALYHLFSGTPIVNLSAGMEELLSEAGVKELPQTCRAVLVGNMLPVSQPLVKKDGTVVHTMWGELAYQLLGEPGYKLVKADDLAGTSPTRDVLSELFERAAPCLVLIDEWVVMARQLHASETILPAGSYAANVSFVQALTEAAVATPRTLVVATIPESRSELGGESGVIAADEIKRVFSRVETPWRPADPDESFEIVRRRLFQNDLDYAARDVTARKFAELYQNQSQEFPPACRETAYEMRIRQCYPIHPELFDRLFQDWSSLEKFQRTRGVLRLMAGIVHTLWQQNDSSPLILPGQIPIHEPAIQNEMMKYLEDNWPPVIAADVDGPQSLPLQIDSENSSTIGRHFATSRVAHTIFLGSAPRLKAQHKGLTELQIKLGCAFPGDTVATFGDALRRLIERSHYLNLDGKAYWYATTPTATRMAMDRAAALEEEVVLNELATWLKKYETTANSRTDFSGLHACLGNSADLRDDDYGVRLVILSPDQPHIRGNLTSPAIQSAWQFLNTRGNAPRRLRNTLVFLAADKNRAEELKQGMRQLLAWNSIVADKIILNLDPHQQAQAEKQRESAEETVLNRVPETYVWLLNPGKENSQAPEEIEVLNLAPKGRLAPNASVRLRDQGLLSTGYPATFLVSKLNEVPLWRGNHVTIQELADFYARYLYLDRLKSPEVLLASIREGLANPAWEVTTFAYADSYDADRQRYLGLRAGPGIPVALSGVLVKPEIALSQMAAEQEAARLKREEAEKEARSRATYVPTPPGGGSVRQPEPPYLPTPGAGTDAPRLPKTRFHATIRLDPRQPGKNIQNIANEVLAHFTSRLDAVVEVTLEIQATDPGGFPQKMQDTVIENCATLKFEQEGFEEN